MHTFELNNKNMSRPVGAINRVKPKVTDTRRKRCFDCRAYRYAVHMHPLKMNIGNRFILKYLCNTCYHGTSDE
jgi:hypothetical protein